jgi:hypothetical protein
VKTDVQTNATHTVDRSASVETCVRRFGLQVETSGWSKKYKTTGSENV